MTYRKPQLRAFSALGVIQSVTNKLSLAHEPINNKFSDPAFEADE